MPEDSSQKPATPDVTEPETALDDPVPQEQQPLTPPAPEQTAPPEPNLAKPPEETTAAPQVVVTPETSMPNKPSADFGTKQLIILIIVTMVVAAIAGGLAFLLIA